MTITSLLAFFNINFDINSSMKHDRRSSTWIINVRFRQRFIFSIFDNIFYQHSLLTQFFVSNFRFQLKLASLRIHWLQYRSFNIVSTFLNRSISFFFQCFSFLDFEAFLSIFFRNLLWIRPPTGYTSEHGPWGLASHSVNTLA